MRDLYTIGIDIGGTNTDIGLVCPKGRCEEVRNLKTSDYTDGKVYAQAIATTISDIMAHHHVDTLQGVGIGAPCGNFMNGTIDSAANLPFAGEVPIKGLLEEILPCKVVVTNDANAAAYGEMVYGGAKEYSNFIMFTIGTGVGAGIIIDGKLLYGSDGVAGELGHTTVIPDGRPCTCGKRGCLETYVSIRGIKETYHNLAVAYQQKEIPDTENSLRLMAQLAHDNDPVALQTYEETAKIMGVAMANAQCFSSPQAFFFMGGVVECGDLLLNPIRKHFEKEKLFIYKNEIPILKSFLSKNDAAILGAAAIAVCEL